MGRIVFDFDFLGKGELIFLGGFGQGSGMGALAAAWAVAVTMGFEDVLEEVLDGRKVKVFEAFEANAAF
jgi:hypothetical protein